MITYSSPILPLLKQAGYNTTRLRREKLLGESAIQQLREGSLVSWSNIDRICSMLQCQPGDILQYSQKNEQE